MKLRTVQSNVYRGEVLPNCQNQICLVCNENLTVKGLAHNILIVESMGVHYNVHTIKTHTLPIIIIYVSSE